MTSKHLRKKAPNYSSLDLSPKIIWTGHILDGNARSNSTVGIGSIVMTPYGSVKETSGYPNDSSSEIREDRVYTLVHENGHQLGLFDHYCKGDKESNGGVCSNQYCCECNGIPLPKGCIMLERIDIEDSTYTNLYCNNCKKDILNYIKNI